MVGVLIRMRWRLTLRSMSSGRASVAFWLGVGVGLIAALGTAALLAAAGHAWDARAATNAAAALYAVWTLGWLCGPILSGSSDETLQPEHFRLLPLSYRQLALGLLAAAFTGPAAVVNLIAFGGLVLLGTGFGLLPTLFAILGTVAQLAFVVLLSRVLLAWIGAAMRSRRGKDLGVVLAAMIGLAYYPIQLLVTYVGPRLEHASRPVELALRIPPSGWAPYAVEAAARGQWWLSLLAVGGLMLLSLVLWQMWAVLLRRRLTTPEATAGQVRANAAGGVLDRLLRPDPVGAVVTKELRSWWRDSRRRAALLPLMLIGIVVPVFLSLQHNQGALPFAGAFVVWMAAMASANMYAFDGTAIWQTLVIPGAIRADVRGRMLAWLIIVAPFGLLLTLILPGAVGLAKLYPWGLATLPVLLGVGIATAMFLSVYAAYPLPQQRGNPFSGGGANPGCARALVQVVVGLGQIVLCLPVIAVLGVGAYLHNWLVQWTAVPVGIAMGIGAAVVAARVVEKRLHARGPELLVEVKPR
ncbi:hypothetical protein NDR87_24740 [Nocardia sp. CDC159]|uniref:ABC-2 type transport system permease protein n=1 Tax=Nocardia pulmonis TaxID=2951408 RepID=A0A9X2EB49_9NOCA|nr:MULTISPECIES: hypothetical protein [Nocardia]MCM6775111.1 hypothetical protein [Nocardia pulmonis]MCM6789581.1 hypothetical protein [Nocardia sp. CDC159]